MRRVLGSCLGNSEHPLYRPEADPKARRICDSHLFSSHLAIRSLRMQRVPDQGSLKDIR